MRKSSLMSFCEKYGEYIHWEGICEHGILLESFIRKTIKYIDFNALSEENYKKLSEKFLEEHKDDVNWCRVCEYKKLNEPFMRRVSDYLCWESVSEYQKLSESFMRDFRDELFWDEISIFQTLSEEFVKEFEDYLILPFVFKNRKNLKNFSIEFLMENLEHIENIEIIKNCISKKDYNVLKNIIEVME